MSKRMFSAVTLKEAMQLIPAERFSPWSLNVPSRAPSDFLQESLRRMRSFNLTASEAAKILLIDILFAEIVPSYPQLKVWKGVALEADSLNGFADYLIARDYAYLTMPLLCVAEATQDDFEQGRAQCIAELYACAWNNQQEGYQIGIFGIVSNGQAWQFYKLTHAGEILETDLYTTSDLPRLLGVLDFVCAECASRILEATAGE